MTKRGEITTVDDDLEVQNFSDSEEVDAVDGEEVIYPSVKPELVRKDSELFKSTLPIKVESTDDDRLPEVRKKFIPIIPITLLLFPLLFYYFSLGFCFR